MGQRAVAVGRQVAGISSLLFAAFSGYQLGRHISLWMYVREHGGVLPADAAMLALPFAIAAFAASIASRSRTLPVMAAMALMLTATLGMVSERISISQHAPALSVDAGSP